ncbi:ABC transporter permease [Parapedobacter koreensis]|uniref:Putative ABC transport system permease protein n=1 Tax=Parapedobacter koreensis TaxID=332977 RepID=A0A1H7R0G4_9SPHI|nr:ABC transporter permease [Parapedobacter koreensis]SEL53047.1 putative ABC transport system permease protein [Parapedobacter koreensis]
MLNNYFKTAWRSLWANNVYAAINIAGLSIGLTVVVLVLLYINRERSYDRWDTRLEQIYRVGVSERTEDGLEQSPSVQYPLGTFLAEECPEVELTSRVRVPYGETLVAVDGQEFYETKAISADSNFFALFPYRFIHGNGRTALSQPNTAVITKAMSTKLFGDADPIGKRLAINLQEHYTITGVIEKQGPSHLDFNICLSYHSTHFAANWFMRNHDTYVRLNPTVSRAALEEKATKHYALHYAASYTDGSAGTTVNTVDPVHWLAEQHGISGLGVFFEPVGDIHLRPIGFEAWSAQQAVYDFNPTNQRPVTIFSLVALLVLLLACVNYTNMAIAQGGKRAKESGVRKVMGASRQQLIYQFLAESFIQCVFAVLLAVAMVAILVSAINNTFGLKLVFWNAFDAQQNWQLVGQLVGVLLATTLLSGMYPAFVLSQYKPVRVLNGDITKTVKGRWLRNGLLVFQYSIASCFIISVIIIALQLRFMRNHDAGFDTDQVLRIEVTHTKLFPGQADDRSVFVKQELLRLPGVKTVSTGQLYPGLPYSDAVQTAVYDGGQQLAMQFGLVNFDYFNVMGMPIVEGRDFSTAFARDTIDAAVINETAARKMGWQDPVGKTVGFLGMEYRVIGVLKDSHLSGYENEVLPQLYMMGVDEPRNFSGHQFVFVKIDGRQAQQALQAVTTFWKMLEPELPVRYSWLDDDFARLLEKHERFAVLTSWLTGAALGIAVMGIFALSAFSIQQRTKEIGIRKVLGASVAGIVRLLSTGFVKLVIMAIAIASPIAWWMMNKWLEDFAYRIDIEWWMFATAGMAALIIALLTLSWQAVRAAVANPVESLRDE